MSKWLVVYVGQKVPEIIRYVQIRLSFNCAYILGTIFSLTEFCKREGEGGSTLFLLPIKWGSPWLSIYSYLIGSNKHIIRQDIYLNLVWE